MSAYHDFANDIRFWDQIQGDAKRTVLCEQHRAEEIRAAVEERGYGHILTVLASPYCPEGKLLIIDEGAMEASGRQAIQRAGRSLYR
ncbi:hypothetical protein [Streptomyces spinosus]|uniref:hypothetical protein n=1 Tax=Streptomyces spinosus TaxID=2872623 RepID=UPI001CEC01B1|nr:hypothetical protein [Streptomyces spinosus]